LEKAVTLIVSSVFVYLALLHSSRIIARMKFENERRDICKEKRRTGSNWASRESYKIPRRSFSHFIPVDSWTQSAL